MKAQAGGYAERGEDLMALFTVEELREVISVKVLAGDPSPSAKRRIRSISTDSRSIRRGDLFVALKGEQFDGHEFVPSVLAKGAAGAIVHDTYRLPPGQVAGKGPVRPGPFLFGVRDPLFAYQQLATHHRSRFGIPIVAVTGSNGKTTTKDMVASVLAQKWRTLKTEGNFNNRIGVPHTLFRLTGRHQAAVIEMGVDQRGQTTRLCEIVRPTIGIITNIGPDHLEFFGSMEGSAQAKAELLDLLPAFLEVPARPREPGLPLRQVLLAPRARARLAPVFSRHAATPRRHAALAPLRVFAAAAPLIGARPAAATRAGTIRSARAARITRRPARSLALRAPRPRGRDRLGRLNPDDLGPRQPDRRLHLQLRTRRPNVLRARRRIHRLTD